jgi:hypothetical protein
MHPLAYDHLKKVLADKKLTGPDERCDYYPVDVSGAVLTVSGYIHRKLQMLF